MTSCCKPCDTQPRTALSIIPVSPGSSGHFFKVKIMNECSLEMPKYQCHKKVWALKIQQVYSVGTQNFIVPADYGYDDFPVSQEYIDKHKPQEGGYYVQYEGGYESYSPAEAFESGYSRI
ncbi:hypothetical protein KLPMCP290B_25070 [Klebsiella pneumoniae]